MNYYIANVKITWKQGERPSVIVDDVDMTMKIKYDSLRVRFPQRDDDKYGQPEVTFTLIADVDIDADAAVSHD